MRRDEQRDHIALVAHLRRRARPGLVWFHPANGAWYGGNTRTGALMAALGVRAGVSDMILYHRGQLYCLELKALTGRASAEQAQFLLEAHRAGAITAIAKGLDEALDCLERWGLILGATEFALPLPLPDTTKPKRTRAGMVAKAKPTMA